MTHHNWRESGVCKLDVGCGEVKGSIETSENPRCFCLLQFSLGRMHVAPYNYSDSPIFIYLFIDLSIYVPQFSLVEDRNYLMARHIRVSIMEQSSKHIHTISLSVLCT